MRYSTAGWWDLGRDSGGSVVAREARLTLKLSSVMTAGLAVGLIAGCGGTRIDAPYPQAVNSRHGLAIRREVGKTALTECPIASISQDTVRAVTPILSLEGDDGYLGRGRTIITLQIAPEYRFLRPLALDRMRWLDGRHDYAWQWKEALGLRPHGSWYATRFERGTTEHYLFQLARGGGYIPFAIGTAWRMSASMECGTWAEDRPIRVLLFTLAGPEEAQYHGVSAYWRGLTQGNEVSFLGVGSSASAQAEFLTILRTSR
jgi:hypothetical protein